MKQGCIVCALACALLCAQLERCPDIIRQRRGVFTAYENCLANIPGISFQPVAAWAEPAPWLFSIVVDAAEYGCSRDELAADLADAGIETRPFFISLHELPPFREESRRRQDDLPNTERLSHSGLNLPTYNSLKHTDIELISQHVRRARR